MGKLYISLPEWLVLYGKCVGKYASPMDPMKSTNLPIRNSNHVTMYAIYLHT